MEENELAQLNQLIKEMSKEIDSNQLSDEKIEFFYELWSRSYSFPVEVNNSQIDSFLAITVALICFFKEAEKSGRALSILLNYLKEDEKVFARFKPNRLILRKMKLERMISSDNEEEVNKALDFWSFVIRYNPDIQYSDFNENQGIIDLIRRGESFRSWGDIEDLTNSYDALFKNFTEHEKTVGNAFQELYNHIEKVKEQLNEKIKENKNESIRLNNAIELLRDLNKNTRPNADDEIVQIKSALGRVESIEKITDSFDKKMDQIEAFINEKVIKRIEQLERHEDEMTTQVQNFSSKVKVEMEKSAKMEDQLKEQLEIISTVNK